MHARLVGGGGGWGGALAVEDLTPLTYSTLYIASSPGKDIPDFILQLWRKIERRPGIIAMSRAGNGGLGYYELSPPFLPRDVAMIPGLLPIFLHD